MPDYSFKSYTVGCSLTLLMGVARPPAAPGVYVRHFAACVWSWCATHTHTHTHTLSLSLSLSLSLCLCVCRYFSEPRPDVRSNNCTDAIGRQSLKIHAVATRNRAARLEVYTSEKLKKSYWSVEKVKKHTENTK